MSALGRIEKPQTLLRINDVNAQSLPLGTQIEGMPDKLREWHTNHAQTAVPYLGTTDDATDLKTVIDHFQQIISHKALQASLPATFFAIAGGMSAINLLANPNYSPSKVVLIDAYSGALQFAKFVVEATKCAQSRQQ